MHINKLIQSRCRFIAHIADLSALAGSSAIQMKKVKSIIGPLILSKRRESYTIKKALGDFPKAIGK